MKNYFLSLGACVIFMMILLGSCSTGDAGSSARILGGSSVALSFISCQAVEEDKLEFVFSRPVTVKHVSFEGELTVAAIEEDDTTVTVILDSPLEGGRLITADLIVEDQRRNSINVLVSFRAKNTRMPQLVINEIAIDAASPRTDFIEFKMLSAGNLGAMRVFIICNNASIKETIFEFAPVEVRSGDYVVLHLRTIDAANKDEYGTNLAESGGRNASPTARDFWVPESMKRIHKTSIVYVLDQGDKVLASVMLKEDVTAPWPRDFLEKAAEFLYLNAAWNGEAVSTAGSTGTRTINRNENATNTNSPADWYITVTSGLTPGGRNNVNRH